VKNILRKGIEVLERAGAAVNQPELWMMGLRPLNTEAPSVRVE